MAKQLSETTSDASQELLEFFLNHFPGANPAIFNEIVGARLSGSGIQEEPFNLTPTTAGNLRELLERLNSNDIEEWLWGLMLSRRKPK